jgi:hypothetical protein
MFLPMFYRASVKYALVKPMKPANDFAISQTSCNMVVCVCLQEVGMVIHP